jgi:hypothetical protein
LESIPGPHKLLKVRALPAREREERKAVKGKGRNKSFLSVIADTDITNGSILAKTTLKCRSSLRSFCHKKRLLPKKKYDGLNFTGFSITYSMRCKFAAGKNTLTTLA